MAIEFPCPNNHPLTMPEDAAGLLVECPLCTARLRVPSVSARAPMLTGVLVEAGAHLPTAVRHVPAEHDTVGVDALGLPVTSSEEKQALRTTRTGISFHRAGVLVFIFGLIGLVVGTVFLFIAHVKPVVEKQFQRDQAAFQAGQGPGPMVMGQRRPPRGGPPQRQFALDADLELEAKEEVEKAVKEAGLLLAVHGGIVAILGLIGSWCLLAVPRTARATGLIGLSLLMDVLHLGASYSNEHFFGGRNLIVALISFSTFVFAFVLFMMFLHRLGMFLGRTELARQATHHLRMWSRLLSSSFLGLVAVLILTGFQPALGFLILVLGILLLVVLWFLWVLRYVRLLSEMRVAIDRRLA